MYVNIHCFMTMPSTKVWPKCSNIKYSIQIWSFVFLIIKQFDRRPRKILNYNLNIICISNIVYLRVIFSIPINIISCYDKNITSLSFHDLRQSSFAILSIFLYLTLVVYYVLTWRSYCLHEGKSKVLYTYAYKITHAHKCIQKIQIPLFKQAIIIKRLIFVYLRICVTSVINIS